MRLRRRRKPFVAGTEPAAPVVARLDYGESIRKIPRTYTRWRVTKSEHPADPNRPWAAGPHELIERGLGRAFPTWTEANAYADRRARR